MYFIYFRGIRIPVIQFQVHFGYSESNPHRTSYSDSLLLYFYVNEVTISDTNM